MDLTHFWLVYRQIETQDYCQKTLVKEILLNVGPLTISSKLAMRSGLIFIVVAMVFCLFFFVPVCSGSQ